MKQTRIALVSLFAALAFATAQNTPQAPNTPKASAAQTPGDGPAKPAATPQAQQGEGAAKRERIITITYDGGNLNSKDLRYGPYVYTHPKKDGIKASVSDLKIFSQKADLQAPPKVLIAEAEGKREASFTGGVKVERGRLTANGQDLKYSEASGQGVMPGNPKIDVAPAEKGDDPVHISTQSVTFNVDTNTSISKGKVKLINGEQDASADELIFAEDQDLGVLSNQKGQAVARRKNKDGSYLTITADKIRVLTGSDLLLATGKVKIVDGDITTTGDTVYYDDGASRAEILGNPAVSVDKAFGSTIRAGRIKQRTDTDVVQQMSDPKPSFDSGKFELAEAVAQEVEQ